MTQFTVYKNPNRSTRKIYPLLLDIQHSMLDDLTTRLVIPLGRMENFRDENLKTLSPIIEFEGEKLVLMTAQLASVSERILQKPVGSLAHFRDKIIAALDFAVTGY